ncbi:MAG TPA: DinB family protein [Pyrinomonadaceae bacterium]|nr:DinB family protein [Pyrinomonadaceae bacterium]
MKTDAKNGELGVQLAALRAISEEARRTFGSLSAAQLNWQPGADEWSVGQCFEHLIKTNRSFFPTLEQIARGERRGRTWERVSPFSGFFGRMVLKSLAPESPRKFKAPRGLRPSSSAVDAAVVEQFAGQQGELAELMKATANLDLQRTVVTSPISGFVTYSLLDAFRIVVMHERRHFAQALRVTEAEGFPREAVKV